MHHDNQNLCNWAEIDSELATASRIVLHHGAEQQIIPLELMHTAS